MRTYRFSTLALVLSVAAFLLAGCGAPSGGRGEADRESVLILAAPAEMEGLNPYTSNDLYSSRIKDVVFDQLLDIDPATEELLPMLATEWERSEDNLTYTFRLRDDVTFHDGEPFTAEDVKFSFDIAMDPATRAPQLQNYLQDIKEVKVIEDYTVEFTCSKPYFRHIVSIGSHYIIPKHVYDVEDFNNHPRNRDPLGSGPYKFVSWDTGSQYVLERNDGYWGELPDIEKRIYVVRTNPNTALQTVARGDAHYTGTTPELWVKRVQTPEFDHYHRIRYTRASYNYIGWNMRRPQFEDKRVRQALTMHLDRETILQEVFHNLGRITTGTFFVEAPEYNYDIEPWPFDPERARALLDEAGWVDSDGDGVRDKDGVELEFELQFTQDSPNTQILATYFQEELGKSGIEMDIRQLEWASFLEDVKTHNFDAAILGWSLTPYPDPYQLWHSSQAVVNGSNSVGFENEEADQLMDEARTVFDRDKRVAMYHRFHEILHEEQPYTFMFSLDALAVADTRFDNIKTYPYGLEWIEWTLAEETQAK